MSVAAQPATSSLLARATRAIARATAPLSRPLAGRRFFPLWAVVHHRGRSSGRPYAVPVAIRASDDAFTIPLPWGEETHWARNVLAAGRCTIRWRGTDHEVTAPRVVGPDDAAEAFHPLQRAILRGAGIDTFLRLERMAGA